MQIRVRAHQGFTHQKTVLLYGQAMSIIGSSNWTSDSNRAQHEHNYFTKKGWMFSWLKANFTRKWTNATGNAETTAFAPLPPDAPVYVAPANLAGGQPVTGRVLSWKPGPWAWKADVYFGTDAHSSTRRRATSPFHRTRPSGPALPTLTAGRTSLGKSSARRSRTRARTGPVWSFGT